MPEVIMCAEQKEIKCLKPCNNCWIEYGKLKNELLSLPNISKLTVDRRLR